MQRMTTAMIVMLALAAPSAGEQSARDGGWRSLVDAKSAPGWRGYRQQTLPDGWTVIDGALTRTGNGGDIITVDQFGDFELTLEYNLAPGGNSGVFFRVTEDDPVIWHEAPEIQVIDNARTDLKPAQTAGANYDLHAPARDATRPAGQWNALRILVQGNHVEQWINGTKVVEYELGTADWKTRVAASKFKEFPRFGTARRGHIGLQDHGDRVAFRNIRIREL